jgi:hypothetical protein
MKQTALIMAAAGFAMSAAGQTAAPAQQPLARAETSFDFVVHASYAEAAPLFGPEGERAWAG